MIVLPAPKFPPGRLVATPAALGALRAGGHSPWQFLARHIGGDWGDLCPEDKRLNDAALAGGGRLLSSYRTESGVCLWLLTESDRSATTILLPEEY